MLVARHPLWADRRFRLGRGKVFALYIALYGFGRIFTEHIRLDYSYDIFGPIRFNEAVAMLICLVGVVALVAADEAPSRPRGRGGVRAGRDSGRRRTTSRHRTPTPRR